MKNKKAHTQKSRIFFDRTCLQSKRAQVEMVGLVIIVVIITIVMLFYVSYSTNQSQTKSTLHKDFAYNELSTSFVQSILRTSACGTTLDNLIKDCGTTKQLNCDARRDSCDLMDDIFIEIVDSTLEEWAQPYNLKITFPSDEYEYTNDENCTADTIGKAAPGIFFIPFYPFPGEAKVELGICKS